MKKILLLTLFAAGITATAQVKVGTNPTVLATDANLQVEGTTTAEQFVVLKNGNVGIGTTTPATKLSVLRGANGEVGPIVTASAPVFSLGREGTGGTKWPLNATFDLGTYATGVNSQSQLDIKLANGGVATPDVTVMSLLGNGNVGIGTTTPNSRLNISGNAGQRPTGAHFEAYINGGVHPIYQNLNWSTDNISQNFDMYYDGGQWLSSGTTNGYMILKNNGLLQFNYAQSTVEGSAVNLQTAMAINSVGNVGIGTATPGAKLEVNSFGGNVIYANQVHSLGLGSGIVSVTNIDLNGGNDFNGGLFKAILDADNNSASAQGAYFIGMQDAETVSGGGIIDFQVVGGGSAFFRGGVAAQSIALTNTITVGDIPAGAATDAVVVADANGLLRKVSASTIGNDGDAWGVTGEDTTSAIGRTGNVGIGTTTPLANAHIESPASASQRTLLLIESNSWGTGQNQANSFLIRGGEGASSSTNGGAFTVNGQGTGFFAGNVGIGTTTPTQKLTIAGTGAALGVDNQTVFQVKNAAGVYEDFLFPRWADDIMYLNYGANGFNIRNNSNVPTMFMTNSGNVGIGTTTPAARLDVVSEALFRGGSVNTDFTSASDQILFGFNGKNEFKQAIRTRHDNGVNNNINAIEFVLHNASTDGINDSPSTYAMTLVNTPSGSANVGIGTTAPSTKLSVLRGANGEVGPIVTASAPVFSLGREGTGGTKWPLNATFDLGTYATGVNSQSQLDIKLANGGVATPDVTVMSLLGNGNVGIGTTTPGAKLEVNGFIKVGSSDTTGDVTPSAGMIKFNSATSKFQGFDGTAWVDLH